MPLTNFHEWKRTDRTIARLKLDRANARLKHEKASEAEVIAEMVEEEDILGLAKKFVLEGFLGVESLIGLEKDSTVTIVEGNRRLTALKLLHDPHKAPEKFRKSFQKLKTEFGANLPTKVNVVVAPTRAEADVYIFSKHYGPNFDRRWKLMQQAVWIERKLEEGISVDDLISEYPVSKKQIGEARAALQLLRIAPHTPVTPEIREQVSNSKTFSYSTVVERIFVPPECQKQLKVKITPEDGLLFTGKEADFLTAYGKILTAATEEEGGKTGTRRFNKVTDAVTFLKKLNYEPKGSKKTAQNVVARLSSNPTLPQPTATKKAIKKKNIRRKPRALFEPQLEGNFLVRKIRDVVEEMEQLEPIETYKNTIGVMLRVLLEITLIDALKRTEDYKYMLDLPETNRDIGPTLSQMARYVSEGHSKIKLSPGDLTAFRSVMNGMMSKQTMNQFVHNPSYPASGDDIRTIATKLQPTLELLLNVK